MISSTETIGLIGLAVVALMDGYAAYWAFGIRRALAVRLYRNQALGIGFVSVAIAGFAFAITVPLWYPVNNNPLFPPFLLSAFITMFYWVDASIRAGRRSDPILRDTFHWRLLRLPLWALILVFPGVTIISQLFALELYTMIVGYTVALVFLIPTLSGALLLPVVATRSRDFTLRRHLQWFALFPITLLVLFITYFTLYAFGLGFTDTWFTLSSLINFVGGYFLYRSARSLVPLSKLSPNETGP